MAEPVEAELAKQEENGGCNIFSMEVEGKTAYVEFETVENAELLAAVYDESGTSMLGSGSVTVYAGENTASVDIEIGEMPQYFYLRGFLINPVSLRPLGTSYESPKYTKDMQDLFTSTAGDYETERVINFDAAEDTNFAVYAEQTILLKTEDAGVNRVTVLDEERQVYQIADANDTALALRAGDVFSAVLEDGTILAVKAGEVSVDGTTVTVTGDDGLGIDEVFSYVKIEENMSMEEAEIDASSCDEGVTYNGLVKEESGRSARRIAPYADGSVTESKNMDFTFADVKLGSGDLKASLNGGIALRFDNTFEYYLTLSNTYISLKMDYNGTITVDLSGHAKGSVTITGIRFSALGILNISFTPKLLFEAVARLNVTGSLSGTVGFSCSVQEGMKNLTTSPRFQADLKAETKLYVGMELKPTINLISDHIAEVSMTATVGGLLEGKMAMTTAASREIQHECASCVDGDVFGKYSVSFQARLLDKDWLTYTYQATDETVKVMDFYYSISKNEFGFTSCPHMAYLVTATVKNTNGAPVEGASVNGAYTTNGSGQVSFYLPNGAQTVTASKGGYGTSKAITVNESAQSVILTLSGQEDAGGNGNGGFDSTNAGEIKEISLGGSHSAALMKDGSLYTWGGNYHGQIGDRSTTSRSRPVKITDSNVAGYLKEYSVSKIAMGWIHSAAVTQDGSLYVWGSNGSGQIGDGTTTDRRSLPVKVMENVAEVSLGSYHSAAVTRDGNLYMWGSNDMGQIGDGTTTNRSRPVKIMENIAEVSLGYDYSAAITRDGSLYLWGCNPYGQIGDGTITKRNRPVKVMENVAEVSLGEYHSAAVTRDGNLYMWGYNSSGQIGDGTTVKISRPKRIAQNIAHVSLGSYHSAAVTRDGSLYVWGNNSNGQIGDGTTTNRSRPVKIMENVVEVSLGVTGSHSAAVTRDGSLYVWGNNSNGQIGDGTSENSRTRPTAITVSENIPNLRSVGNNGISDISASIYDSLSTYAETSRRAESRVKTVTYTDLKPNADYLFYSMKYKGDSHPLGASNLLYLIQERTDEKGSFTLNYTPDEDYATPTDFVVAMAQTDISEAQITVPQLSYTGLEQYINPALFYNEQRLAEGKDYRLTGAYQADKVGEYSFSVTGIGAFKGSRTVTYNVEQTDCKTLDIAPIAPLAFHGEAVVPKLTVKNGEVVLQEGTDYTASFQNNKGAGLGIAIIEGLGNYSGRQIVLFDINPCTLSEEMLAPIPDQIYTGEPLTPEITLSNLTSGGDYRAEYSNNVEVGMAEVIITGIGSYTGSLRAQFQIVPKQPDGSGDKEPGQKPDDKQKDFRLLEIPEIDRLTYTGSPLTPDVAVNDGETVLAPGKDYTVSYQNNTNVGIGILLLNGTGDYMGRQVCLFEICPRSLDETSLIQIPAQEYTGIPVRPAVVIEGLVSGRDYQTKYSNNTEAGTANVTITGTGNYTGTIQSSFQILPKKAESGGGDPVQNPVPDSSSGNQSDGNKEEAGTTPKKGAKTSAVIKKLTVGKTYYVRIRAYKTIQKDGINKKLWGSWSNTIKSKKVK